MLRRFYQYCIAFVVLSVACAAYESIFVAWIEPEALPEFAMASSPVLRKDDSLASMFAKDSWQRGECKRLQTRDGVLLFQNWQQLSNDQWKLWPVSVVLGTNGSSPLVLEAMEGAEIKFTESLDVMSGGAPPIELGRMIGAVRIHNAFNSATNETGNSEPTRRIEIEASEVGIDHRKVWTTQPIRLRLGDATLTGRDLTLHLSMAGGIAAAGDNGLSILDRLELIYLDELTVPLADGGLWGHAQVGPHIEPTPQPARPTPIGRESANPNAKTDVKTPPSPGLATLRCGGRVVFQFATGELTLQDRVELRHKASADAKFVDTFVCDQMRMRFTDLLAKRERGDQLQDYLLSMIAIGRPARATLPSFEADLAAGQIELDTRSRLVRMGGPAGVLVSYAGNRWQFGQVNYLIHPTDPKLMGTFDATGPGGMDVAQSLAVPVSQLRWKSGIKLERIEPQQQLSLRVDGQVTASMTDGGTFSCDSALLMMEQVAAPELANAEASTPRTPQLIPKRFQATGQVRLETPAIAVDTRLLQLYFESDPNPPAANATPQQIDTAKSDGSLRRWVKQPGSENPNATLASRSTPVARARPSIHGDTINAKLRLSGGNVTARDLTVVGDVTLQHEIQTQSGPLPAVLTGDRLLLSDGGGNDVLQIGSGVDRPARFDLGDGYFIGPLIQVRMADNVVWIKDAGEFQMPTQVLPRVGTIAAGNGTLKPLDSPAARPDKTFVEPSSTKPSNIEWVNPPRCRWKGQMVFDGRTAIMSEGVDIHATVVSGAERDLWDLQMVGEQLQLVLDQDVKVREVDSVKAATIDHVTITGSAANPMLVTANQLTAAGSRKARHVLAAPQLTIKPQTGTLTGPGPGWYRAWTQSNPAQPFVQPANGPTAPASMYGIHLVYEQSLDADMKAQSLNFVRGVRIAARRVNNWDDLIDVAQIQGLRLGESTIDCDRLRLAIDPARGWAPITTAWEMEAIGNVAFQSRIENGLYNGTADRASYTAAKDIFLIEGTPSRAAVMNQTLPTGQPGMSLSVNRMTVNPKTMELQNVEFDRLQPGALPAAKGR